MRHRYLRGVVEDAACWDPRIDPKYVGDIVVAPLVLSDMRVYGFTPSSELLGNGSLITVERFNELLLTTTMNTEIILAIEP